jgi:hypothetical protein
MHERVLVIGCVGRLETNLLMLVVHRTRVSPLVIVIVGVIVR